MNGAIPPIHHDFIRPPYPSYSLPGMPGPVMANVNSPNTPMSLVGAVPPPPLAMLPFHSGNVANPQSMYGVSRSPHTQQQTANDRPFRCDQCPQSFNRNHDLKRHKRIHLAVKPFPCGHCDKTFSRKDALKVCHLIRCTYNQLIRVQRHILVKGCGKDGMGDSSANDSTIKSESDSASDSPAVNGTG